MGGSGGQALGLQYILVFQSVLIACLCVIGYRIVVILKSISIHLDYVMDMVHDHEKRIKRLEKGKDS